MSKKIALNFNKREFARAEKAHKEYKDAKVKLEKVIEEYGVEVKLTDKVYVDTCEAIYNKLSEGSNLPASMNKLKFLELMDVNLVPLSQAVNTYNSLVKYAEKPSKEKFTTYVETEAQMEQYNALKDVVKALNDLDKAGFIKNKMAIQNAFANKVSIDYTTTNFKVNI